MIESRWVVDYLAGRHSSRVSGIPGNEKEASSSSELIHVEVRKKAGPIWTFWTTVCSPIAHRPLRSGRVGLSGQEEAAVGVRLCGGLERRIGLREASACR